MQIRFLLGPAGSGKTFGCVAEIRNILRASPEGPPLIFLTPKQSTYQLERQLLGLEAGSRRTDIPPGPNLWQPEFLDRQEARPASFEAAPIPSEIRPEESDILWGYTRLQVVSFERLSHFVLDQLGKARPRMLDEEGRLMVLRGLLSRKRRQLKLFRASAHLTGFAQELSRALEELQRHQLTPEEVRRLASQVRGPGSLGLKLQDLATLLEEYLEWLDSHGLVDGDCLLSAACAALKERGLETSSRLSTSEGERQKNIEAPTGLWLEGLWVDGFADFARQELELLAALMPCCGRATFALCVDSAGFRTPSWLSPWTQVRKTYEACKKQLEAVPGADVTVEALERHPERSRLGQNPVLSHIEQHWAEPREYAGPAAPALRLVACADPEAEVTLAAREILRYTRAGGRFREVSVLVRELAGYHDLIQRVFPRYEIPFFLDRRESVAHHPLAELTRGALRTVVFGWQAEDWFAALKTGLASINEEDVDLLENEALARGWKGAAWQKPLQMADSPDLEARLEKLRRRILPPFQQLESAFKRFGGKPTGPQLAAAVRDFWANLQVEHQLQAWMVASSSEASPGVSGSVHGTVLNQLTKWLENLELAFADEALSLREWLPILDAGLGSLTVGVIPPALDQVLVGAVDRSRNPEIKMALVLGLNEGVFPARPKAGGLLTDAELAELEEAHDIVLGASARHHLGRERYLAYIACTRARERLVLTYAAADADGAVLNPSPFVSNVRRLVPSLVCEPPLKESDWRQSEHISELIAPMLSGALPGLPSLLSLPPALVSALEGLGFPRPEPHDERLSPELAEQLYGSALRTSVSRVEQFAACPFKFFVHSGLRAQERKKFELDAKEQGSFQHEVLARFHNELRRENKRWRDLSPAEARRRVERIAGELRGGYRDGLFQSSEQSRFVARVLAESLQDFVETLVAWMREQYQFDPVAVELPFGEGASPCWVVPLDQKHSLQVQGRIDRIDFYRKDGSDEALCVVVDYKSSEKKLNSVLMANGLQLQLPTYLNVLRHWANPSSTFGVNRLVPAGVFYVNLRGKYNRHPNRREALADAEQARKAAYRHAGRFDRSALRLLDTRAEVVRGDQFNYALTQSGEFRKDSREALPSDEFTALLEGMESSLKQMGLAIYAGECAVAPYRLGQQTACSLCEYRSICRIDPWTQSFRILRAKQRPD